MFVTEILCSAQPHPLPLFNIFIKNFMTTVSYCITPVLSLSLVFSPFLNQAEDCCAKVSKLSQTASERKFKCYLRSFPLVKSFYFLSIFPKALLINSRKFNLILYNILGRKCSMEKLLNPKTSIGAVKKPLPKFFNKNLPGIVFEIFMRLFDSLTVTESPKRRFSILRDFLWKRNIYFHHLYRCQVRNDLRIVSQVLLWQQLQIIRRIF